jgi:hypothetical protein
MSSHEGTGCATINKKKKEREKGNEGGKEKIPRL